MYQRVGYTGAFNEIVTPFLPIEFKPDYGYRIVNLTDAQVADVHPFLGNKIPGDWQSVRIIAIKPTGLIHLHRDPLPDGKKKALRYHVVLVTNPYSWKLHDGVMQRLELGGIYTMDEMLEHASVNWGVDATVNLVIDSVPR